MTLIADSSLMTAEQFLSLPDDRTERHLIGGRLVERDTTMRGRRHTRVETSVARVLANWVVLQPEPRGEVLTGEAGFRLAAGPDTLVGVDVAYISATMAAAHPDDTFLFDGPPVLAVEILSPSDTHQSVTDKIASYLAADVQAVWLLDPAFRLVLVFRPHEPPALYTVGQRIVGHAYLPGFDTAVADLFVPTSKP